MVWEDVDKKIAAALEHVHPRRIESQALKTKRLTFRLRDEEFEEIRNTAESLGMSIADYFCALHRHAVKRLNVSPTEAEWVHRTSRKRNTDQD